LKCGGRSEFQKDHLGQALIEWGLHLDFPNIADLKDMSKRPGYIRKIGFVSYAHKQSFFCKNRLT
jgi:hypothetical protein